MDDNDVRRLEDRIEAAEERGRLRMETALVRIEGAIGRIAEQTTAIRQELQEQRADSRAVRTEIANIASAASAQIQRELGGLTDAERAHFNWLAGLIIVFGLSLAALLIGLNQVWTAGVQSGQALQQSAPGTPRSAHQ